MQWFRGRITLALDMILKKVLYYIYKFDKWHLYSTDVKPYIVDIINVIKQHNDIKTIVEIGCGLGGIIGSLNNKKCVGIDLSPEVIKAARILHPKTRFFVGGFDRVSHKRIDCLITVNFMHAINPVDLKAYYDRLFAENRIKYVVFDSVKSPKYKYNHIASEILGDGWEKQLLIGKYPADRGIRYIELYKKRNIRKE